MALTCMKNDVPATMLFCYRAGVPGAQPFSGVFCISIAARSADDAATVNFFQRLR